MRAALDTAFLVALVDARDKWHPNAVKIRDVLKDVNADIYHFDCVINETVSVLARRLSEQHRAEEFPGLLDELERLITPQRITDEGVTGAT